MKLVKREPDEGHKMNMTPMIDVVFQLLIFFMLVSEMTKTEKADLVLPKAAEAIPDQGDRGRLTINVQKDGKIMVGPSYITLDELDRLLKVHSQLEMQEGKKFSDKPILIRADKDAYFEKIQMVMGKCRNNKIWKVSFGAMVSTGESTALVGGGER